MRPRERALPPSQQMLAPPAPSGSASSAQPKSRGNQNNRKAKARGKGSSGKKTESNSSGKSFQQIMDMGPQKPFPLFVPGHRQICWKFQKCQCNDASVCKRKHNCTGCNTEGKPYDSCHCRRSTDAPVFLFLMVDSQRTTVRLPSVSIPTQ